MTDIGVMSNQRGFALPGYFTTAEKRNKDVKNSKSSHFTLGNHPRISTS
jgi:hypothetical protein